MRDLITLFAKQQVDNDTGFRYRVVEGSKEKFNYHTHDYYELFITLDSEISHFINNSKTSLPKNSLVFIRPEDRHMFIYDERDFTFINIAFDKDTYYSLKAYIGSNQIKYLENLELPMIVNLKEKDIKWFNKQIICLNQIDSNNKAKRRIYFRGILFEIFKRHLIGDDLFVEQTENIPYWIKSFKSDIQNKDIFSLPYHKICDKSKKNHEYLSKCFKKYYGISLNNYINSLRLSYVANALVSTNYKIIDIFIDCGYENISWATVLFKEKYNMSPREYRRENSFIQCI